MKYKDANVKAKFRQCPICGNYYNEPPALSRLDNETLICPDCGIRQALATLNIDEGEQQDIIDVIHRYNG